jgi:two-component system response regulator FlrC
VRELENIMQRAVIFAPSEIVEADALHLSASVVPTDGVKQAPIFEALTKESSAPLSDAQKTDNMRDLEREHILETLALHGGSRKLAGERLGMSERTLRHKLKQYRDAGLFDD